MLMQPVTITQDRSIAVPPGYIPVSRYVSIDKITVACRDTMAIGDVDRAYQKRLQLGEYQPYPCPRGHWEGETFVIEDGRHEFVGALMLGFSHLLVTWLEPATEAELSKA